METRSSDDKRAIRREAWLFVEFDRHNFLNFLRGLGLWNDMIV
jgi:hypothetical protein